MVAVATRPKTKSSLEQAEAEMPAQTIMELMRQGVEAGTTDGKTHSMFTWRMEPGQLQQMSHNVDHHS
jgi:hypothetical protein